MVMSNISGVKGARVGGWVGGFVARRRSLVKAGEGGGRAGGERTGQGTGGRGERQENGGRGAK